MILRKHSFLVPSIILIAVSIVMSSCITAGDARDWLSYKKGDSRINITGEWDSGSVFSGGWGSGYIVQTKNEIVGTLGLYTIEGAVNGDTVYIIFISGNRFYYSGQVKYQPDGTLVGTGVEKKFINSEDARDGQKYPIIMRRYKATR
jgi:hypothetical protein